MRDESVEAFIPSSVAAPFSPETFHLAASSARRILARSSCSSSFAVRMLAGEGVLVFGQAAGEPVDVSGKARSRFKRPSVAVITARSITFCSSRTLPGQL